MTAIYLTGTRTPGDMLLKFLPDFIAMLISQGHDLITSNKQGVDDAIIQHCTDQSIPLHVCEFLTTQTPKKRYIEAEAEEVTVGRIFSPTWQRFRYLADHTEKMIFLHAAKTRGKVTTMPTLTAFEKACHKRQIPHEQYIVQHQGKRFINATDLRQSPCMGTAHLYIYVREVPGMDNQGYHLGYYRIETWRALHDIIQPGMGRKEIFLPTTSRQNATLQILRCALQELQATPPYRLVIHHCFPKLEQIFQSDNGDELRTNLRADLGLYPQICWQKEDQPTLQNRIGSLIRTQQELWYHDRMRNATKGLYQ